MADKFSDYYYLPVTARAKIGGGDGAISIPITQFSVRYFMDRIPEIDIEVAIGRELKGKGFGRVSKGMGIITQIEPFKSLEVTLRIDAEPDGRAAPKGKNKGFFPGTETTIFKGFIRGIGQNKNTAGSTATLSIQGFGFPGALAGSTQFLTGTTIDHFNTGSAPITAHFGGAGNPRPLLSDLLLSEIQGATNDLWTNGIKKIYDRIATQTDLWFVDSNDFAKDEIARIDTGQGRVGALLSLAGLAPSESLSSLNKALSYHFVNMIFNAWADYRGEGGGADLWNILINLAGTFFFRFVPFIEDDALVPVTLNLGGEPYRVIDPSEYWALSPLNTFDRNFYAYTTEVGLFASAFQSGEWQDRTEARAVGKARINPEALSSGSSGFTGNPRGRLMLFPAPNWLLTPGASGKDSLRPGAFVPDAANPDGDPEPPSPTQGEKEAVSPALANGAAGAILHDRVFAHRRMSLQGRLRLDIAPGSLVQVNTVGERFANVKDTFFGHVLGVSIQVTSGGPNGEGSASTSFIIGNIRSQAEHGSVTVDSHPLYGSRYVGTSLTPQAPP